MDRVEQRPPNLLQRISKYILKISIKFTTGKDISRHSKQNYFENIAGVIAAILCDISNRDGDAIPSLNDILFRYKIHFSKRIYQMVQTKVCICDKNAPVHVYVFYDNTTMYCIFKEALELSSMNVNDTSQVRFHEHLKRDIKVGNKYAKQYHSISDELKKVLLRLKKEHNQLNEIICCGHHVGAAIATIASVDLGVFFQSKSMSNSMNNVFQNIMDESNTYKIEEGDIIPYKIKKYGKVLLNVCCITFGSPRVGNKSFRKYFNEVVAYSIRIVDLADPFHYTPCSYKYIHIHNAVYFQDSNGKYLIESTNPFLRHIHSFINMPLFSRNHHVDNIMKYVEILKKNKTWKIKPQISN
jgi:hypothetical protein